ncbi:hypothetical protein QVD17_14735 [Tagetes erecta]|uniref:Uncharacterized protein n=1 Tax=Tagetes erecta TaxID=13708 RepID=A0AAD8KNC6_TARER|nr:hypothetical protein QVD17_14735 [Tagetes erecta]
MNHHQRRIISSAPALASPTPPSSTSSANTKPTTISQIRIFKRHPITGGRMATVTIAGEAFNRSFNRIILKQYLSINSITCFQSQQDEIVI